MLVQEPNCESLPSLGRDEVLANLRKTSTVVITQGPDVGGVHVGQRLIVGHTVITYL
jgi:hypothetical protein